MQIFSILILEDDLKNLTLIKIKNKATNRYLESDESLNIFTSPSSGSHYQKWIWQNNMIINFKNDKYLANYPIINFYLGDQFSNIIGKLEYHDNKFIMIDSGRYFASFPIENVYIKESFSDDDYQKWIRNNERIINKATGKNLDSDTEGKVFMYDSINQSGNQSWIYESTTEEGESSKN